MFYYYLFLLLAEPWVVPHPLQILRGFGGGGGIFPPSPPGYATGGDHSYCTLEQEKVTILTNEKLTLLHFLLE